MNFNDIVEKLDKGRSKLVKKGKDTREILTLRGEIKTCESVIDKSFTTIGKKYYEQNKDTNADPEYQKHISDIENAKKAIDALLEKINSIRAD